MEEKNDQLEEINNESKNNSLKIFITIISIIILLVLSIFSYKIFNKKDSNNISEPTNTNEELEELKEDFYTSVNKDLIAQFKDEVGNSGTYSTMASIQEEVDEDSYNIIKQKISSNENPNLTNLYNSYINKVKRNTTDVEPLKPYINLINNSKSIEELIKNATTVEKELSADLLISASVTPDPKNNTKYIVNIGDSSGCAMFEDDYKSVLTATKNYGINLLTTYGYDKKTATTILNNILSLEQQTCENVKSLEELSSIDNIYNPSNIDEVDNIFTNINVKKYYNDSGLTLTNFNIIDRTYLENYNNTFINENLETLKQNMIVTILSQFAPYTSEKYEKVLDKYELSIYGGNSTKTLEEEALDLVKTSYQYTIEEDFLNNVFDNNKKTYVENMINDIIDNYKLTIKNNTWLSDNTKELAINKLDNINIYVGGTIIDNNIEDSYVIDENNSLLENVIYINKITNINYTKKVNDNIVEDKWPTSIFEVNAYYYPSKNAIYFPASILYLVDIDDSYYTNLGKIGMIIAHEISHAFDSDGAMYDAEGNLNNWWEEKDYNKFKEHQQAFIDFYGSRKSLHGYEVNGTITLGENIADLSAINCITEIAIKNNATNDNYKEMYEGFAKVFASTTSKRYERYLTLTDTHSPDSVRINAGLSNIDKFYEVYNVSEDNPMYVSKENRIRMW